jgi:hypothetical protein
MFKESRRLSTRGELASAGWSVNWMDSVVCPREVHAVSSPLIPQRCCAMGCDAEKASCPSETAIGGGWLRIVGAIRLFYSHLNYAFLSVLPQWNDTEWAMPWQTGRA